MKRILIAAALGSTICTIPALAFDGTIYGNFRGSYNLGDFSANSGNTEFVNNASRLGVKGATKKNENELQGIYHLEMGAENDNDGNALTSRFFFAGLQGKFGKVIYGRLTTPYKMAGLLQDPFYDTSAGPANAGSNYGYSSLNNGFTNNSLAFYSPKIAGGLTFHASFTADDSTEDDHDYGIGAEYATEKFKVGISHLQLDDTPVIAANGGAKNATRIYGSTSISGFTLNASYELIDFAINNDSTSFFHINGIYQVMPKLKALASYGMVRDGVVSVPGSFTDLFNSTGDGYNIAAFYDLLPNTTLTAIFTSVDYDGTLEDRKGIALGVIQKF